MAKWEGSVPLIWTVCLHLNGYVGHVENDSSAACLLTVCCMVIYRKTWPQQLPALSLCFITPEDKLCSEPKQTHKVEKQPVSISPKSKFLVQKLSSAKQTRKAQTWRWRHGFHIPHSNVRHINAPEEDSRFSNVLNLLGSKMQSTQAWLMKVKKVLDKQVHTKQVRNLVSGNCTRVCV